MANVDCGNDIEWYVGVEEFGGTDIGIGWRGAGKGKGWRFDHVCGGMSFCFLVGYEGGVLSCSFLVICYQQIPCQNYVERILYKFRNE